MMRCEIIILISLSQHDRLSGSTSFSSSSTSLLISGRAQFEIDEELQQGACDGVRRNAGGNVDDNDSDDCSSTQIVALSKRRVSGSLFTVSSH